MLPEEDPNVTVIDKTDPDTKFRFSYIIPLGNIGGPDYVYRLKNLDRLIDRIPYDVQLIIVEQIVDPDMPMYNINLPEGNSKKIIVKHSTFNKLWLFNLGARRASVNELIFAEGDILIPDRFFDDLEAFIKERNIDSWCFAWGQLHYQGPNGRIYKSKSPGDERSEGGLVYFSRKFFYKIGMANEWIQELGGDDNELVARSKYFSKTYLKASPEIIHQYHPRSRMNAPGHHRNIIMAPHYKNNVKILEAVIQNPERMSEILRENIKQLGKSKGPICSTSQITPEDILKKLKECSKDYSFDYIIPVCNIGGLDFSYRVDNLRKILPEIPSWVRIILTEQQVGDYELYRDKLEDCRIDAYLVSSYPIFNKSWILNMAARAAATEHLLFADADMFWDEKYFNLLFEHISYGAGTSWCIAWNKLMYLNFDGSLSQTKTPSPGMAEGGVVYFNKDFFWKIGLYNEWIQELGGMDNEIIRRAEFFTKDYFVFKHPLLHLWHPYNRMKEDDFAEAKYREYNRKIYYKTRANPKSMTTTLLSVQNNLGRNDKPISATVNLSI